MLFEIQMVDNVDEQEEIAKERYEKQYSVEVAWKMFEVGLTIEKICELQHTILRCLLVLLFLEDWFFSIVIRMVILSVFIT